VVQSGFLTLVLVGVFAFDANCERWCPFGGVEALYTYVSEGNLVCSLATSNFFILGGVLAATFLVRRAFCGYMCPIGTISEWIHQLGRRLRLPAYHVPRWLDGVLSLLKYIVLAVVLVATWRLGELVFRGFDPCYALISRHGPDITHWAYVVSAGIVVASLLLTLPFCRWLCPLAAVLNPFSRFAPGRIHRHDESCRGCGVCAKRCPMAIPVDAVKQVTHSRCISCWGCVDACPANAKQRPALSWGMPRPIHHRWAPAVLLGVLLLCTSGAVAASYLFPLPSFVKSRGTPPAEITQTEMMIENLTCRGRANLLVYFLERDDLFALPGYVRLEAWPSPTTARIRIGYDATRTNELAIKQAITEPYYDAIAEIWRNSPFVIEGYDPLAFDDDLLLGLP
jgi:ferredoxin